MKEAARAEWDAAGSGCRQLTVRSRRRHLASDPEETAESGFHGQTSRWSDGGAGVTVGEAAASPEPVMKRGTVSCLSARPSVCLSVCTAAAVK